MAEGAAPIQYLKSKCRLNKISLFSCCLCLGFWIGIAYYLITTEINLLEWGYLMNLILFGGIISVASEIVSRILANNSINLEG